jgi:hypothetical protein
VGDFLAHNRSVMVIVARTEPLKSAVIVSDDDGSYLLSNCNLPGIVLAQTV